MSEHRFDQRCDRVEEEVSLVEIVLAAMELNGFKKKELQIPWSRLMD